MADPCYPLDRVQPAWPRHWCALCGTPGAVARRQDSRCGHCASPLAPALHEAYVAVGGTHAGLHGRRAAVRRDRRHAALIQVGWPAPLLPIRWRDLSLTGLSFVVDAPIAPGSAVRVLDEALEAVAEVVACSAEGRLQRVHARLLTVLYLRSGGVFVSTSA